MSRLYSIHARLKVLDIALQDLIRCHVSPDGMRPPIYSRIISKGPSAPPKLATASIADWVWDKHKQKTTGRTVGA
jgi:hypothetical protein